MEIDLGKRTGRLEQVTLQRRYAGQPQYPMLLRRFDAFRSGLYAESLGKNQRRLYDRCIPRK